MLDYGFGKHTYENPVTKKTIVKFGIGVKEPYGMLSPIGDIINDPVFIEDILANLSKVMSDQLESYGWGCDMALVQSYKEKSVVEYMDEKDGVVGAFQIEIPTQWLFKLMEDWKKYLQENIK